MTVGFGNPSAASFNQRQNACLNASEHGADFFGGQKVLVHNVFSVAKCDARKLTGSVFAVTSFRCTNVAGVVRLEGKAEFVRPHVANVRMLSKRAQTVVLLVA